MASRRNGGTFNEEVREAYIKHSVGTFIKYRYSDAFMRDINNFRFEVVTSFDPTKMATRVSLRTHQFEVALMVADDVQFEVKNRDDWMLYQLQRMEPLTDTLMFIEWFYAQCGDEDRRIFRDHLRGVIKEVHYLPPKAHHGPQFRSRYDYPVSDGRGQQVAPDWLACVKMSNDGTRREILDNIAHDPGAFIAMMLMVKDNRQMTFGNA